MSLQRFEEAMNAYGHVEINIRSTTFSVTVNVASFAVLRGLLHRLRTGKVATFGGTDGESIDFWPYYRRWTSPYAYRVYCRDERKTPVVELQEWALSDMARRTA